MIKAVIFDYYGVLTNDSYMTWLDRHPDIQVRHAEEIEVLSKAQDEGMSDEEFFAQLGAIAGRPAAEVHAEFDAQTSAEAGLLQYIRHLRRQGLRTAILSNAPTDLYQETARRRLDTIFDVILCSEEVGVAKPDPEIYHAVLRRLNVKPAQAVFIDDRDYNVQGARAVGMAAIEYAGLGRLKASLTDLGIIIPAA